MLKRTHVSCPSMLVSCLLILLAWPVMAEAQALKLDGTATCFRALREISEQYRNEHGGPEFEIRYGGPFAAVERLGNREIDIGMVEFPLVRHVDRAWAKAFPQGKGPAAEYTFAQTALGVVVNKRNPLSRLTQAQVSDIWSGNIRTWQELVGRGGRIKVLTSKALSGSMVSDMILYYGSWTEGIEELLADSNVIATVAGDALAIGFVALTPDLPTDVKLVAVAAEAKARAVPPTIENVVLERYPLVRQYKLLLTEHSPPAAHDFAEFACSDEAQKTVQRWGLFPATIRAEAEAEQRVADVKAGKGQPLAVCDLAGAGEGLKEASFEFARAKMAVQVTLDGAGGSVEGAVERLETGTAELLVVDGRLGEAMRGRVVEMGGAEMVLGSRAVGVVVHPQNPFNELAIDDLRQILAGETDRWPGATGTAERMVLYGLPPASPLMRMADEAIWGGRRGIGFQPVSSAGKRGTEAKGDKVGDDVTGNDKLEAYPTGNDKVGEVLAGNDKLEAYPTRRAKVTARPDTGRVLLSVAAQPGALGLVDLTKIARHETKVKLLAILPPGEQQGAPPAPDRLPEGYPLARPVYLYVSPKASEAAKGFFEFLAEGNARDALLAGGLVPRPKPDAPEAEVAAAYGLADDPNASGPPARLAAAFEDDAPAGSAPGPLQDVLRGALGDAPAASAARPTPGDAQSGTGRSAESAAEPATPGTDRPTPQPAQAPRPEAAAPAAGDGSAQQPAFPEPSAPAADFGAWIAARAVPLALIGSGVVVIAVMFGSLGMKRARHRNEVLRRYRP
ncbi:MAG: substrate-binding domain-containing protein [Thermoguttaceae bacterium]|nr:substrate-binding domain-containing protein [Thermoguttaceae bacterium]